MFEVRRIELNASPLGSTPIAASTRSSPTSSIASANTSAFDTDWDGEWHTAVAYFIDVAVDGRERDTEMRRVGALQFGM